MITVTKCKSCGKYEDDLNQGLCIDCEDHGTGNRHDPMAEEYELYQRDLMDDIDDDVWPDEDDNDPHEEDSVDHFFDYFDYEPYNF